MMMALLCAVCGSDADAHETKIHAFVPGGSYRAPYIRARSAVLSCPSAHRWRGETCRNAWPVSVFAWCDFCKEGA